MGKIRNVVFVAPLYVPAHLYGSEIIVRDLAESLVNEGITVSVITSNVREGRSWYIPFSEVPLQPKSIVRNVHITRLSCANTRSLLLFCLNKLWRFDRTELLSWGPLLIGLEDAILEEKPDIVIMSPFPAGLCLIGKELCEQHGIPYAVIPFFKKDQAQFQNRLLIEILNHAGAIFSPTHTEIAYISRFTHNASLRLLPSSINLSYIRRNSEKIFFESEKLKKDPRFSGKKIVLFVGNKGKGKGIIDAAMAIQNLQRPDVVFVTMGSKHRDWNIYLKRSGNRSNIVDVPYCDGVDKFAYFQLADLLILPSVTDNYPLVFLEAWQFKKAVLAYDFYAMKELLGDGSGFTATFRDIDALSRMVDYLLDSPKELRKAGMIGYKKIHRHTREVITQTYFLPVLKKLVP